MQTLRGSGAQGRWLVLSIVGLAILMGLIGMRFRHLIPRPASTQPATAR